MNETTIQPKRKLSKQQLLKLIDGLEYENKSLKIRAAQLNKLLLSEYKFQEDDIWYWEGDGNDHIPSMTHEMRVVITAEDLRDLLVKTSNLSSKEFLNFTGVSRKENSVLLDQETEIASFDDPSLKEIKPIDSTGIKKLINELSINPSYQSQNINNWLDAKFKLSGSSKTPMTDTDLRELLENSKDKFKLNKDTDHD